MIINDNLHIFTGDNICPCRVITWFLLGINIDYLAVSFILKQQPFFIVSNYLGKHCCASVSLCIHLGQESLSISEASPES